MQSSIAVRGDRGSWFLVNASPDLREQLRWLRPQRANGPRTTPIGGVLLTDAEIDHSAGLLLLRESSDPLRVFSTDEVRRALTDDYPVLRMLENYCGVQWSKLEPGRRLGLGGSSLEVQAFPTGGHPPRYVARPSGGPWSVGLSIRERAGGPTLAYAPALALIDDAIAARLDSSDCVLVDGTFWEDDELVELGVGTRGASAMGHVPLAEPDGSLRTLVGLRGRTILVHVNNTNPILLEDSPERATVRARGIEVAYDGMEIDL